MLTHRTNISSSEMGVGDDRHHSAQYSWERMANHPTREATSWPFQKDRADPEYYSTNSIMCHMCLVLTVGREH